MNAIEGTELGCVSGVVLVVEFPKKRELHVHGINDFP